MARRQSPFFPVDEELREILTSKDLTQTDHRLFWYLCGLDRFGDRRVELPSWTQIAKDLGVTRQTINASQTRLQELGLWDFSCERWMGINLKGSRAKKVNVKSTKQPSNQFDSDLNQFDSDLNQFDSDLNQFDSDLNQFDDRSPETTSGQGFQRDTDLIQTNTDLKQTFTDPESAQGAKKEESDSKPNSSSLAAETQSIAPEGNKPISRGAASENDSRSNVVTIPPHRLNPVERFQARFSNGGAPPAPWLTGPRWDSLQPEFLEYLVTQLPRKVFRDADEINALEAKRWATRAMANEVRYCDVEGLWGQMNEDNWKPGTQSQTDYDAGLSDYGTQHLLEQGYIKPGERWDPVTGEIVSDEVSA